MYLSWIIGHKIVRKVKFWEHVIMLSMIISSHAFMVLRSDRTMRWWMFLEFSSSCRTLNVSWVFHVSLCTVYKLQFFQGFFWRPKIWLKFSKELQGLLPFRTRLLLLIKTFCSQSPCHTTRKTLNYEPIFYPVSHVNLTDYPFSHVKLYHLFE